MPRTFRKIKRYGTFVLLFSSIFVLIILGVLESELFKQIADISGILYYAIIAVLSLFGFVAKGVVKTRPKSFAHFLDNGLVQIAALQFFIFVIVPTMYVYLRPGEIELKLASGTTSSQIRVSMIPDGDSTKSKEYSAPNRLLDIEPGVYTFRIIEENYHPFDTMVELKWSGNETVILQDRKIFATLIVDSTPKGAEIWIDGSLKEGHTTPDTLNELDRKLLTLELKLKGYKSEARNVDLAAKPELNLGQITLRKLYKVKFLCGFESMNFVIAGKRFSCGQDNELLLPEGRHDIIVKIGNQAPDTMNIVIEDNCTKWIP